MIKSLFLIILYFQLMPLFAQSPQWEKIKDENGIQVYTQQVVGSGIVKAKCTVTVNHSLKAVQALLDNVAHRHNWIPFLKSSEVLTSFAENKRIETSLFSAPWPASNREFVYSLELIGNGDKNIKIYKMHSVVSDLRLETDGLIRADLFESIYTLKAMGENKTAVELVFHADPKGWLPNWLINIIQRHFPYKVLRNLRLELDKKL